MPNPHGWGLGTYTHGPVCVERKVEPAYASEAFRWAAARVYSCHVMAHVRHATVGRPRLENTHPFQHGAWLFAHNGTIEAFEAIRSRMLAAMPRHHRRVIQGDTDSEHIFHLLLSLREQHPDKPLLEIDGYRAVVVASEQITTTESGKAVPEASLFCADANGSFHVEAL